MKIVIIGAHGAVGSAIVKRLADDHELILLGQNRGDLNIDITDRESICRAFEQLGSVDAIVNAAGLVAFKPFAEYSEKDWAVGLQSKLMGQIRLVEEGSFFVNQGGSITLISGITSDFPIRMGISAMTIGAAIEGFAKAAAAEAPRGLRINVVSPTLLDESLGVYGPFFPGFFSVPGDEVAQVFERAILGLENGHTYKCFAGNH